MVEEDPDARIFLPKVGSHMLRTIDRAMLTPSASEAYHETGETTTGVGLHMRIHDTIDMLKKTEYLPVIFKEPDHRFVTPRELLVWLISSRIVDGPAVEHISSPISRKVHRQSLPI